MRSLVLIYFIVLLNVIFCVQGKNVSYTLVVSSTYLHDEGLPIYFGTRLYNNTLPGPTLRVQQGDTLTIVLINNLMAPDSDGDINTFHNPNTTNIHLHGLHVSPLSDNVFLSIPPGSQSIYTYNIPLDHPVGTFFYHPHVHGSSSLQQSGGMAGAFIVDENKENRIMNENKGSVYDINVKYIDSLYDKDNNNEIILLLQHLCFDSNELDYNPYMNHKTLSLLSNSLLDLNITYNYPNNKQQSYYLVNGKYLNTLQTLTKGVFTLFRLINAAINSFIQINIQLLNDPLHNNQVCDMYIMARDGIFVPVAYQNYYTLLVPGSRADIAVRCNTTGTYVLLSNRSSLAPYNSLLEEATPVYIGDLAYFQVIEAESPLFDTKADEHMDIDIDNKDDSNLLRLSPEYIKLPEPPKYLTDLTKEYYSNKVNGQVKSNNYDMMFYSTQQGPIPPGPPYAYYTINGVPFTSPTKYSLNMSLNEVWSWRLTIDKDESYAPNHPFHIHVNPFQIALFNDNNDTDTLFDMKIGEWRDSIALPHFVSVTALIKPDRFVGPTVFHCHMVPHIDLGMMAVAYIQD